MRVACGGYSLDARLRNGPSNHDVQAMAVPLRSTGAHDARAPLAARPDYGAAESGLGNVLRERGLPR